MPYTNKDDQRRWLQDAIRDGYGKRLYARRKLWREHSLRFKQTIEETISVLDAPLIEDAQKVEQVRETLRGVLRVAEEEEALLRGWKR